MRTRFAPSPTGFLHVGGLRTALYAYLIARKHNGKFLLRIEDTDQARSVPGAIENILATLHQSGLDPDEGVVSEKGSITERGEYGPYFQSKRLDIYKKYAEQLIEKGDAYYAFDTPEEIDQMKKDMQAAGHASPNYNSDARMRMKNSLTLTKKQVDEKLKAGEAYVIRFKIPEKETITFEDDVRGTVEFQSRVVDDQVLIKSDGFPTYHMAHVVDDHLMRIDIVIRGEEWLPSAPKHILLFKALGWTPPKYAHVPLLLNKDKTKLSKRQNDVAASEYLEKGYLPEALLNFVAFLGWNPGTEQELFSLEELIQSFSIDRVQKAGAVFDTEKLDWLQGQWIRKLSIDEFISRIKPMAEEQYPHAADDRDFAKKAALIQERITFLHESVDMLSYCYEEPKIDMEIICNPKQKVTKDIVSPIVKLLIESLEKVDAKKWNHQTIEQALTAAMESSGFKKSQMLWTLRSILTGRPFSPGAYEVADVLGKEKTLERLKKVKIA